MSKINKKVRTKRLDPKYKKPRFYKTMDSFIEDYGMDFTYQDAFFVHHDLIEWQHKRNRTIGADLTLLRRKVKKQEALIKKLKEELAKANN